MPAPLNQYQNVTMLVKSHYQEIPVIPPTNYHNILFHTSPSQDYVIHIDTHSGQQRTRFEFMDRIKLAATALTGCLQDRNGNDFVGIVAFNSSVC